MESEIICKKCGMKYIPCVNHLCKSEDSYIYCKICDIYLLSQEYKDHIYCHSLESNKINRNFPSEEEIKEQEEKKNIEESYDVIDRREAEQTKEDSNSRVQEESKTSCQRNIEEINNNNDAQTNPQTSFSSRIFNAIRSFPYDKIRIYNRRLTLASFLENTILNIIGISLSSVVENSSTSIDAEGNHINKTERSLIDQLPEVVLTDDMKLPSEIKECIICLMQLEKGAKLIILPCFHVFHSQCIKDWLNNSIYCPLCKFKIIEKNMNEKEGN